MRTPARSVAALLLAVAVVTCVDSPVAPTSGAGAHGSTIAFAARFASSAAFAAVMYDQHDYFVDHVEVIASSGGVTLKDTTFAYSTSDSTALQLSLPVNVGDTVSFTLNYLSGSKTLFSGSGTTTAVTVGGPVPSGSSPAILVPVGPGAAAAQVTVSPPAGGTNGSYPATGTLQFGAVASDATNTAIPNGIFTWSISDSTIAVINDTSGLIRPKGKRGSVTVTATTIDDTSGHATISLVPVPSKLIAVSGAGQTGVAGSALQQPFVVKLQAADTIGSPGQVVTFAVSGGGSANPTTMTTDSTGNAHTSVTLGTAVGTDTVTATVTVAGVAPVVSTETVSSGGAKKMIAIGATSVTFVSGTSPSLLPLAGIEVTDAGGSSVAGDTITVTLDSGSVSGPLKQTATAVTDANGQVTLAELIAASNGNSNSGEGAGTYVAIFSNSGLTGSPISVTTTITPGAASQVQFETTTQLGTAGVALPPVTVAITDAAGNVVTSATGNVVISLSTGPAGATLSGTVTEPLTQGVATFSNLILNRASGSTNYSLKAASNGFTAISNAFPVNAGAPVAVSFATTGNGTVPSTVTAGATIGGTNGVSVIVLDNEGNKVTSGSVTVTMTLTGGSGTLSGTTSVTSANGTANFNNLSVNTAGTGYQLVAAATGLTGGTSTAFAVTGTTGGATKLSFATEPLATAGSGITLANAPAVQLVDANNNVVATSGVSVVASVASGTRTSSLSGQTTASTNSSGQATFSGLTITGKVGSDTLLFTSGTLPVARSTAVVVSAGTAAKMNAVGSSTLSYALGTTSIPLGGIQVVDGAGNGVTGVSILVQPYAGSTVTGSPLTSVSVVTDTGGYVTVAEAAAAIVAQGVAALTPGTFTVAFSKTGLSGTPISVGVTVTGTLAISFAADTMSVGRGATMSIPISLNAPSSSAVVVSLTVLNPSFATFSQSSVTIQAHQTSVNVNLNGLALGTTKIIAIDQANKYAGDTTMLAVEASLHLASTNYFINGGDTLQTQVQLSDPAPAGGTSVTFVVGNQNIASVAPTTVIIPVGQLAANITITAGSSGITGSSATTTITPASPGVNGTSANFTAYQPVLTLEAGTTLGVGQNNPFSYIFTPTTTNTPILVTLTSSDPTKVTVTPSVTIARGSDFAYDTITAIAPGTATITASAPGWTASTTVSVQSQMPALGLCCAQTLNTTSPSQVVDVYPEDSVGGQHYLTNPLVVHLSSSDPTVLKVLDSVVTIQAGQDFDEDGMVAPGGNTGVAYLVATANGYKPDTAKYTLQGPKLEFTATTNVVGVGENNPNFYVTTPNAVTAPLTVTIANSDPTKLNVPDSVTVANGNDIAFMTAFGQATGTVTLIASAHGYTSDTVTYTVSRPRVALSGGGILRTFEPAQQFTVYAEDSTQTTHVVADSLHVSLRSTNPSVVQVDTSATIGAGAYFSTGAKVTPVDTGTAMVIATIAGGIPDTVTYQVQQAKLGIAFSTLQIGVGQSTLATNEYYVSTPDDRSTALQVTLTHGTLDSLTSTSLSVPASSDVAYFGVTGLTKGTDMLIASAPGYASDTAVIVVTTPYFGASGIPSTGTTITSPPFTVVVYLEDSLGTTHYSSDTVTVHAVSSNSAVLQPTRAYFHVPKGNYYGIDTVDVVGAGTATITYSDSVGVYNPVTTNAAIVTGASLGFGVTSQMLGMRQTTGATGNFVYVPNNVTSPLIVSLLSTSTLVATVPDSVVIPIGQNYVYFPIYGRDTIGTVQIQATATGYPQTNMTVQVTHPMFLLSTASSANTTGAPQYLLVQAADANGTSHYTTENVSVSLASSATSVASTDSAIVHIDSGNYYNESAHWLPHVVGTTQLSASDARTTAFYQYSAATAPLTVTTPTLTLSSIGTLGIGQYTDNAYVETPDVQTSATTVTLSHQGHAFTTTVPATSVTVPAQGDFVNFRMIGDSAGTDSLVANATSPLHNPATTLTVVGQGRIDPLSGWPSSTMHVGDSLLVTLYPRDPSQNNRNVLAATTWTLVPSSNLEFTSASGSGAVITSVTVPALGTYVQFYVKALAVGTGTVSMTSANYQTYTNSVTIITP